MADLPYLRTVSVDWDRVANPKVFPFSIPAVKALNDVKLHPHVTFIIGENGSGKSTILEGIAAAFGLNPEGGNRSLQFSTRDSHTNLGDFLKIAKAPIRPRDTYFLRAESFYNLATKIDQMDSEGAALLPYYGGVSLHEQSHGESFLSLFVHRLHGKGLYILDEPEAALSPTRQMALLARMHELAREECQFIVATHSPIILAYPGALILEASSAGLNPVAYEETDTYRVMRDFLANPARSLRYLLGEGEAR